MHQQYLFSDSSKVTLRGSCSDSADERCRGRGHKLLVHGSPKQGLRPDCDTFVFFFLARIITCRMHKLTLSDQAKVAVQVEFSLSDFVLRLVASPSLLGRPQQFFFTGTQTRSRRPL